MTTWLLVALYTASRTTAREQAARSQLEDELRQSQKLEAVGRLAGGIAHDFNNLLTVVTGYSQLVLDDLPADSALRPPLEEVKRAGDRAASLVKQLLAFSRRQRLEPRVLSLNGELTSAAGMLRRVLGDDIRLVSDLDAAPDHVTMDPGQLHQIVLNLAVNARDAMPHGGSLTIATSDVHARRDHLPMPPAAAGPRALADHRHRRRHGRRDAGARLRAVLHHEAAGPRHRAWPRHRLRHRRAERRHDCIVERAGRRRQLRHRAACHGRAAGRRRRRHTERRSHLTWRKGRHGCAGARVEESLARGDQKSAWALIVDAPTHA